MTQERKNAIVDDIMALLIQLTDEEAVAETKAKSVEMLTIKECTEVVRGLVAQGQVKYIRTGQGKHGKILVNKEDLVHLFA